MNDKLSLRLVDAYGNTDLATWIRTMAHGGFFVEALTGMQPLLLRENKDFEISEWQIFHKLTAWAI